MNESDFSVQRYLRKYVILCFSTSYYLLLQISFGKKSSYDLGVNDY